MVKTPAPDARMTPPPDVASEDTLGRSVFSRRRSRRARQGQIDMDIFLEREDAESISVDRMDHAPIHELAAWSTRRGRNRTPPQAFQGWAVLTAKHAGQNGRTVVATPRPENRCHADIFPERHRRGEATAAEAARQRIGRPCHVEGDGTAVWRGTLMTVRTTTVELAEETNSQRLLAAHTGEAMIRGRRATRDLLAVAGKLAAANYPRSSGRHLRRAAVTRMKTQRQARRTTTTAEYRVEQS